jgi:hypothetical protein
MGETAQALADYSVALGYFPDDKAVNPTIFGSGVFVHHGNRYGILTAHHCVYPPGPDLRVGHFGGHRIALILKRGQPIVVQPEVMEKHALANPHGRRLEPDLAFLEFAECALLSSLRVKASFWSLGPISRRKARKVGKPGTLFTVVGFPGLYQTKTPGTLLSAPRHAVKHMAYYYVIDTKSLCRRDGWDYIQATNVYGQGEELPESFEGVSGGPIWGLRIHKNKRDGVVKLKGWGFALIGIAFLQIRVSKKKLKIRGHFIDSIYQVAWSPRP